MPDVGHHQIGIGCKRIAQGKTANISKAVWRQIIKDFIGPESVALGAAESDLASEIAYRRVEFVLGCNRGVEWLVSHLGRRNEAPFEMIHPARGELPDRSSGCSQAMAHNFPTISRQWRQHRQIPTGIRRAALQLRRPQVRDAPKINVKESRSGKAGNQADIVEVNIQMIAARHD